MLLLVICLDKVIRSHSKEMSRSRIYKLAAVFQQVLPGMFQESGVQEVIAPRAQDREGNLYWPCFHCKRPIREDDGLYVTDEEDLENFERYVKYEETLSDEDTLSAEKLVDARAANDEFYNKVRAIVTSIIRDINALSPEALKEVIQWHYQAPSNMRKSFEEIKAAYQVLLRNIEPLFDKHYYYNNPETYDAILKEKPNLTVAGGYWPQPQTYFYGNNIKAQLYTTVTDVFNEVGNLYKSVANIIAIASQAVGTKKYLIQRHVVNHPICDRCYHNIGAECYVPSCNFTSSDIDDFHKVEIDVVDKNTNKTYQEEKLFCDEHGFKCDSCNKEFISNPYELFGETNDRYGYGEQTAFGDSFCDDCFNEIFGSCEECNEVVYREDLVFDEKTETMVCNDCATGGGDRKGGAEKELNKQELADAKSFVTEPSVGDVGYPIDPKVINTQILPALKKISNKRFKSYEQWKSWLMKRLQSKEAKAAVMAELQTYVVGDIADIYDEDFEKQQEGFVEKLIYSFSRQAHQAHLMGENYPDLRGYKPLAVDITIERTPGHTGYAFVIRPAAKLLDYADMMVPGAKEAYNKYLSHRGHHSGALAYARFTKSNDKIVVDNLQTDLDSQALQYELRDNRGASKPLQWWLTATKKFWIPFMLNLLRQYGQKTKQEVYLTSYKMQKSKWRTIPERNKDVYDRAPEMMGFPRERAEVRPEDLARKEYKMRRIAEFVNMFCKLARN